MDTKSIRHRQRQLVGPPSGNPEKYALCAFPALSHPPSHRTESIFHSIKENTWETAFADAGLSGLALVVEQAAGGDAIREHSYFPDEYTYS